MAELRKGTIASWRSLSPTLAIFRLMPQAGAPFPDYQPGQYMALRREDSRITRRIVGQDGRPHFVPDLDAEGHPKRGPVTHSYSISSAPFETQERGHLEFYVVLEFDEAGEPGRLTESLFHAHLQDPLTYVDRIVGDFTMAKRAKGMENVVFVGTGTGLAPFTSMVKELDHAAQGGVRDGVRYTLFHANRTRGELGYHEELQAIAAAGRFDFVYIPSVSRPTPEDHPDPHLGFGRANNLLRHVLGAPLKEEADLADALARGGDGAAEREALSRATRPRLPPSLSPAILPRRLDPPRTVILTCGNPSLMADIKTVADLHKIRFEKEDW